LNAVERTGLTNRWFYNYDSVGNRTRTQAGDSVTQATFNAKNQLVSVSGGGPLRWRGTLNEPGSVTFTSAAINGKPAEMLPGNVFQATLDMAVGLNTVALQATDASGNVRAATYQVDVSGTTASYTYDPNGNLTQKIEGSDTRIYEWDAANRLKRVLKNTAEVTRFSYDPFGRRVEKVVGATTTAYVYDDDDIVRQTVNGLATAYVHGLKTDEPLAREDSGGNRTYLHADGLGSLMKETDSAGAVMLTRKYDAFGNPEAGSTTSGYAFTGREWETEVGLYYYRARYYDPQVGRFVSEDPIDEQLGENLYSYALDNPGLYIDPTGETLAVSGYGPSDLRRVMHKIARVRSTPDGRRLLECVERSSRLITISPPPPGTWTISGRRTVFNRKTSVLNFDLDWHPKIPTTAGRIRASGARMLAHELGHACLCIVGNPGWSDEKVNIRSNENPVARALGQPARTGYLDWLFGL